jgi:hypothetical protein
MRHLLPTVLAAVLLATGSDAQGAGYGYPGTGPQGYGEQGGYETGYGAGGGGYGGLGGYGGGYGGGIGVPFGGAGNYAMQFARPPPSLAPQLAPGRSQLFM